MKIKSNRRVINWEWVLEACPLVSQRLVLYFSDTDNVDLFNHSFDEIMNNHQVFVIYVNKAIQNQRRLFEFFDKYKIHVSVMFADGFKLSNYNEDGKKKKEFLKDDNKFETIFSFRINSPYRMQVGSEYPSRKIAESMAFIAAFEVLEEWLKATESLESPDPIKDEEAEEDENDD